MKEMTLEEFLKTIRAELDYFEKEWPKRNRKYGNKTYPMKMGVGDWDEQFRFMAEDMVEEPE